MSTSSAKITRAAAAGKAAPEPMSLARMRRAPTHPGALFLEDFLDGGKHGRQSEAARAMGWSVNRLNEFVNGRRSLTADGALDLAAYTDTSAEFWLQLQLRHDLWTAMQARKAHVRKAG